MNHATVPCAVFHIGMAGAVVPHRCTSKTRVAGRTPGTSRRPADRHSLRNCGYYDKGGFVDELISSILPVKGSVTLSAFMTACSLCVLGSFREGGKEGRGWWGGERKQIKI